jgi:hypothetical protein
MRTPYLTLYDGDTFEHRGRTYRVNIEPDQDTGAPWEECDGHGIVSEWTRRDKAPGERILCADRHSRRYYDVRASIKLAIKDGWGPVHCATCGEESGGIGSSMYGSVHKHGPTEHPFKPETRKQTAARAVQRDFEYLRGWCNDDWTYVGVTVTLLDEEGRPTDESDSLWGVESLHNYPAEVARELADQIHARIEVDEPRAQLSEN